MTVPRRQRLREAIERHEATVPPTPETLSNLRHDVVGRLVERGRLHRVHAEAAEEIRTVAEAVGRGMYPRALPADWTGRPLDGRFPRDFLDRMTARERRLWQHRYLPWTRELSRDGDSELPGARWLQLVLDIVIENCGLRRAERRNGLRHGAALGYLAVGLERYDGWRIRSRRGTGFG